MTFPTYQRLARLYHTRMMRLFSGRLWEMIERPELAFDPEFQREAWRVARGMASEVARTNANSWREAAMKSGRAREIYASLRAEIAGMGIAPELDRIAQRNASLISSLPGDLANWATARASELHQKGARPEDLERELRAKAPKVADSRLRLIARTELSRAETDLTRERAENLGLTHYVWETSKDQRVRKSHRLMDGVIVSWSDAPAPEALAGEKSTLGHYAPGSCPNCRCIALPLVDVSEVRWPAKVHVAGRIARMSRAEFTRATGVRIAA